MKILAYDTFPQEGLSDFETVLSQSTSSPCTSR